MPEHLPLSCFCEPPAAAFPFRKATMMQAPSMLRAETRTRLASARLQGIALGVGAIMIGGHLWGWVSGHTASSMASTAHANGQMSVLVPLCVAQFMLTDGALAKFKVTPRYGRAAVVGEFVTEVAGTPMSQSLARACAVAIV